MNLLKRTAALVAAALAWTAAFADSTPARVDFAGQVQPLLRTHCAGCHGPTEQMAGLRIDQRGSALKLRARRVVPGSSANSRVYLRVVGGDFGPQMPPGGPLAPEQIALIRDWIDQGAEWPDALAGDPPPPPPPDAGADALMDALRRGDRPALARALDRDPQAARRAGAGGSTPLMYAVLYGATRDVQRLLEGGADPNAANQAGATALMWAVGDAQKVRVLLEHGADANARTPLGQTPLSLAASRAGSRDVVMLLLDHGAHAAQGSQGEGALLQAADAGDADVFSLLLEHGAPTKAPRSLVNALRSGCRPCVDAVIGAVDKDGLEAALVMLAPFGDEEALKRLLDRGADVDARREVIRRDMKGRTPLLLAASSDFVPIDAVRLFIDRGAKLDARGPDGETALDLARRNGGTAVVELLVKAGVPQADAYPARAPVPQPGRSARDALARSLPLLQRSDATFLQKAGCVSCHSNTLTTMAVAAARSRRLPVDTAAAAAQRANIAALLDVQRDDALLGAVLANGASSALVGLAAERRPPDATTDALAILIRGRQRADGSWRNGFVDHRPPLQGSDIELTASSIRALRVYAPATRRAEYDEAVRRGRDWLMRARPRTTDEHAMRLLGLRWAGLPAKSAAIADGARALLAQQRADGGWAQLPSLPSDAYATGQTLFALNESGALGASDRAYRRGARFLLDTQLADGSWYVKTRSLAFQPYFESGFPHGSDQWISNAATGWASMALAATVR